MALPERERAAGWVGLTVVDRDGAEIGSCTAVYADDATGLTEWMSVGFEGRSVIVPVVDAAESGGRVQVAVVRADVASAPSVDDGLHVFGDEEVALYRHYGIEYSRAASDTVLPAGEAPSDGTGSASEPSTTAVPGTDVDQTPSAQRGPQLAAAAAALTALVAVVVAVIRLRRRPSRRPPVRRRTAAAQEAARRARVASVNVRRRTEHLAGVTAPLLATVGQASLAGARTGAVATREAAHAATRLTTSAASRAAGGLGAVARATAPLLTTAGHLSLAGARTGAVAAREAAYGATRLTATAASLAAGLLGAVAQAAVQVGRRVGGAVESVPEEIVDGGHRIHKVWRRAMGMLSAGVGLAAGYVLGARAGRQRFEQIKSAASTVAQRPEVQQALQRVKSAAAPSQEGAGAQEPTAPLAARLRRRRPATDADITAGASSSPASDADIAVAPPARPAPAPEPPAMP